MDASRLSFLLSQYPFREIAGKDPAKPLNHIMTCPVRLAFAHLDKPKSGKPRKDGSIPAAKFSSLLIVPAAANLAPLLSVVSRVGTAKFGAAAMAAKDEYGRPKINMAIKRQKRLADKYEGFGEEGFYIDASSNFAVPVVGGRRGPEGNLESVRGYSGMWALVQLRTYTYSNDGNEGIGLGLVAIQKLADDTEFKGGDVTGEFGELAEHPSTTAPASAPGADLAALLQ
jgi:hypothetical protein